MARNSNKPQENNQNKNKIFIHQLKPIRILFFEKLAELIYGFKVYLKFKEINKKYGLDIVEAPEAGAEGFWLSIFARKKLVTRLHTPLYLCWKYNKLKLNWSRRLLNFMEKTQAKRSALLSCSTQSLANIVSKIWQISKDRIQIIPSPFYIMQTKNDSPIRNGDYFLCLGKVEKIQGVDILIKALKIILKKYPELQTICVGGIDQNYYNKQLKNLYLKIKQNLVFIGEVNHNEVLAYIKQARLIVLPALWENFPYKLLESMSLGKLVIASDCGGFKEIIEDGKNGFLFKTGSHYDLAQKIIECLNLEENKIKIIEKNAQKTVRKFSLKRVIPKIVKFYSRAI
jgi:glycosyltransferase involved in cell wall biosynthesis